MYRGVGTGQMYSLFDGHSYMDNRGNSRANTCAKTRLLGRVVFILVTKPTQAQGAPPARPQGPEPARLRSLNISISISISISLSLYIYIYTHI